ALAAMVVSCSKGGSSSDSASDNLQPTLPPYSYEESDTPIGFDGYEQSATSRAYVRDEETGFVNGDSFGVLASLDPADDSYELQSFMDNIRIQKFDGVLQYSGTKYWPYDTDIKINFYAYYPHSIVGSSIVSVPTYEPTNESPYPTLTYTPSTNAAYQYDFMTAVTTDMCKDHTDLYTGDVYTGVPLSFEHQLAKVKFSANFHNSGDNTDTTDASTDSSSDRVVITKVVYSGAKAYQSGTFTADGFDWGTLNDESTTYTLDSGLKSYETDDDTGKSDADLPLYTETDTTYQEISNEAGEGVFLLHPQTLAGNAVTFTVTFKVFRNGIEIITANQTYNVASSHTLEKGKAVNYQFTIDINNVSSVLMSNVVYEDWEESDNDFNGTIK
ncbi:MAG: fimbrillin family protein, partial [Rikenellaceae bacterium]